MTQPLLSGIDHFHLYVTDKQQSLKWYQKILGFQVVESLLSWNEEKGPLTIEDQSGSVHLALFTRSDQPPSTSIAFKSTGKEFLNWKQHLTTHNIALRIADHQLAWSMYFSDEDSNMHEITTYEHAYVSANINANK